MLRSIPLNSFVIEIQRIFLTGFPAQSVGSSNIDVLDSPCLLVLITGTSQSRQHDVILGLKIGKATFQRIEKSILDKDRILNWHVLLLYAEFPKDNMFDINELLDVVDQKGESINEEGSSGHPMYDAWF
ncbi:hypothetical protein Tco_1409997 [Tanacetum coccineum]